MSEFRNIGIRIAYDGSAFHGWQYQRSTRTVEGVMRDAIKRLHGHAIPLTGAGRTDSHVHARGQYANFHSDNFTLPQERFCHALNALLPHDVRVTASREEAHDFHARYSARYRRYQYKIRVGNTVDPCYRNYVLYIPRPVCVARMNRLLRMLVGRHDFRSFCQLRDEHTTTTRTVFDASMYCADDGYTVTITANGFCRKMIRSIMGTLLSDICTPTYLRDMLATGDRSMAGSTLPPHGLYLDWVGYA